MDVHLADIFRTVANHPRFARLPRVVGSAFRAVMECGTAALGGHWSECENGHIITKHYNACRNRSCPRCSHYRRGVWLERLSKRLLGCPHNHLIFTIPHEVNEIWLANYRILGKLLFGSVKSAVFRLAADPAFVGGVPGVLMVLHTWGQQLVIHPHIHVVITAGGAVGAGLWRWSRRRHLFAVDPLRELFMEGFLAGLLRLAKRGELRLPEGWGVAEVKRLGRRLRRKHWNIELRERYEDPTAVLNYLGRYLSGGPIAESRLVGMGGETVRFRYKNYRKEGVEGVPNDEMTLTQVEFVRRVLQHVPPSGFHTVRGYGLYRRGGGRAEEVRLAIRKALPLAPKVHEELTKRFSKSEPEPAPPSKCPICGKRVWVRWRARPGKPEAVAA